MKPGEYFLQSGEITANEGRVSVTIVVKNSGDRPVQVGSHFHFYESNRALIFDRTQAYGKRLSIASGTAIRFEPGQTHQVDLIPFTGTRTVFGFNRLVEGHLDDRAPDAEARLAEFINDC